MQNDIGNHKPVNPEKYESHKTGTCGECKRLGRDLMEMIQLKNNVMAERDFYFKLEAEKQKCCQELHLKISEMQQSINFWMKAKDEAEREHKHEFQADTDGHPYCRKCGRYAYSNTYKPICVCEDRNTDYHLTVCCAEKILINKEVAKKWSDEMLAQAKYARLSGESLINLLNEIRKSL